MRWTTGYPFGVNLCRGYPRFNPGEFSTVDLLVRGDIDAALILGADPGATMPQPAIDHLARIPTIVLDPKVTHTSRLARVHITTAATGISAPGTVYRMDEMPLPLRPALKSPYPTDEEVIRRIRRGRRGQARPGRRPRIGPRSLGVRRPMLRITGGKVYDPAQRHRRRGQGHLHRGRPDRPRRRRRPHDRRHGHGRASRRRRRPHPRGRRRAQLRPGDDAGEPAPGACRSCTLPTRRMGLGGLTPTTFATGYLYAGMGYTTVIEAAVPVLSAKHTHEELRDTPIVDKACLRADGQQRDRAGPPRGRRDRAGRARRGVADLGREGLRGEGGQSRAAWLRGSGGRTPRSCRRRSRATAR